ncbi:PadR family transcriptional regulator [Deinococcus sp. KSM4-11]|uniref:PadR family transcriptional regulator n=1 Tax=Deinococcus sp. KSM4-11 TaxID=2568654 RepID=UPI0010A39C02|nr:PadR family transcriptional regulator [Deinococcus sp. KSM4-11]THF85693.1 PadR family transcriptional regulator [Deinococcus sp. KSM4-11]
MSDATLGPSSYIVLGLLGGCGGGTSYDLKRWADESVGFFWTFPRSQLYAEPQRLTELGLLTATQEPGGRRRRRYAVTEAGHAALQAWLDMPAGQPELRDEGLLKLFFSPQASPETVAQLAAGQLALHRHRLATYESFGKAGEMPGLDGGRPLAMGLLYERASVAFWFDVLAGASNTTVQSSS